MEKLSPASLYDLIIARGELAIVDLREEGVFAKRHLLFATNISLSHLELLIGNLIPRRNVLIVLCGKGDDSELILQGEDRIKSFGYKNVTCLDGGIDAWERSGYQLFSGINVPSKAFGECVELNNKTPHISAVELGQLIEANEEILILDARPINEYEVMNIPGGINVPGGELSYRIHDLAPDPNTTIVVNCAGRTRSIIGAQSLINAGIPNRVVALENGTMGWHLAGKKLEYGRSLRYLEVSKKGREIAILRSKALVEHFNIENIPIKILMQFLADLDRTTYLLDVRDPTEYERGHILGSVSAPGGQLVQATDQYVGVLGARLVLIDDDDIRAIMAASWLKQMGWADVFVLEGGIGNAGELMEGPFNPKVLGEWKEGIDFISSQGLEIMIQKEKICVIDLASSLEYRDEGHIPGAFFVIRARIQQSLPRCGNPKKFVLTSPDGMLAALTSSDKVFDGREVLVLRGGTASWIAAGLPLEKGFSAMADEPEDKWYRPYDLPYDLEDHIEGAMKQYLSWEVNLTSQIERDGTAKFSILGENNLTE